MNRFIFILPMLAATLSATPFRGQISSPVAVPSVRLHAGERIVFYGDSITAQRLYTRFLEDIVVSRYPALHVEFHNAGVSGDTVAGGSGGERSERVRRDVLAFHPTLVSVMLGMNDGRYRIDHPEDLEAYRIGYGALLDQLRAALPTATILVIKPSPYDEVAHGAKIAGYNRRLQEFGKVAEVLAQARNMPVCDLNAPMNEALHKAEAIDPAFAASLLPDRIHPSEAGHWVLALALSRCMGVEPTVSETTIDVADLRGVSSSRVTVSDLRVERNTISWTELEQALPLPLELESPVTGLLDRIASLGDSEKESLRVQGLSAKRYRLLIDDAEVGYFSAVELAAGVNLALRSTPMETAARAIDWKTDSRAKLSATRFNLLTSVPEIEGASTAISALDTLDQSMEAAEWASAQPKPHRFSLVAQ